MICTRTRTVQFVHICRSISIKQKLREHRARDDAHLALQYWPGPLARRACISYMGSSDADMARQLQEQFDREEAQHQRDVTLQQPTPPPPSSSRPLTLAVVVPAGTSPGQTILVQAPSGQQVQVELPAHAVPGQTIQVSIPPQLLVQQAAQPEPEGFLGDAPGPPLPS
eukprot:COSAG02_NODE_21783_length_775_cov_0.892012_1_plen_167_part_01